MVRQREAVQEQQGILHGDTKPSVDAVRHANTHPWKPGRPQSYHPQEVPDKGQVNKANAAAMVKAHTPDKLVLPVRQCATLAKGKAILVPSVFQRQWLV